MPGLRVLLWESFLISLFALILLGIWSWARGLVSRPMPRISPGELEELYRKGDIDITRYMALKERMKRL